MDIFISGDLTTFAPSLAIELLEDGHLVVTSCDFEIEKRIENRNFTVYQMTGEDALFGEIFRSHTFDLVVHITAQRNDALDKKSDGEITREINLEQILSLSVETNVEKFVLITSLDIYGNAKHAHEEGNPQPNTSYGQILENAENLCRFYAMNNDLSVSIVRIPYIYGPHEINSMLTKLIQKSKTEKDVVLNVNRLDHCNLLHIDDLINFIERVIDSEKEYAFQIFNLATEDINFDFLTQQLNIEFPNVKYSFSGIEGEEILQKKIEVKNAELTFGWIPNQNFFEDLPTLSNSINIEPLEKKHLFVSKLNQFAASLRPFLVWIEVILGAFLMQMLTVWTNTIIEFKYIDYRLIYVVIIGSTHGLLFGIIAALLAAISAVFAWNAIGLDFALLIYNVENWIPFTVFFLAGAVTGYIHDKKENEINFERNQTALIHEKYEFLYSLYNEISTIKNRLREQLVGYRDSFGRFFRITNELNEFDEDNIFFKALDILEDLMKNDQISIYSIEPTGNYGRLEVKSKTLTREIPKSMRLANFDDAVEVLKSGNVFQNKDLIANYPSYMAPISNGGKLIGLIIIWEAKFEQFNLYYFNLFKVITGLIQSSLIRAATFKNAQTEKLYIASTQIMKPEPFKQSLSIRKKMRRNKISEFLILRVARNKLQWNKLYEQLSKGIRADDIVGVINEVDDFCYVLLANADIENISMIQERLNKFGIKSEHIEELESE